MTARRALGGAPYLDLKYVYSDGRPTEMASLVCIDYHDLKNPSSDLSAVIEQVRAPDR